MLGYQSHLLQRFLIFCLWPLRIFPSFPGSLPRFLSRCRFSTVTPRQPMLDRILLTVQYCTVLTFPLFPLRNISQNKKSCPVKNRTHYSTQTSAPKRLTTTSLGRYKWTTAPVLRDQIHRRERGQANMIFPVQLVTSRIDNLTQLIHILLDSA